MMPRWLTLCSTRSPIQLLPSPPTAATTGSSPAACDQDQVTQAVAGRHPDAAVIVPPRAGAVASASAEIAPAQRGRHLRMIADRGHMAWQKASGYNLRAKVEASIGRASTRARGYKRVMAMPFDLAPAEPRRPRLPLLPLP